MPFKFGNMWSIPPFVRGLLVWWFLGLVPAPLLAVDPGISEVMADNKNSLSDEDGEEVDWIEIHNPNPVPFDLAGWYLSDSPETLTRWQFPAVSVNAGGYLVVFASGKDRRLPSRPLHTSFSLRAAGEQVVLTRPDGITVVSSLVFGAQQPDVSYGRTAVTSSISTLIGPQAPGRAMVPSDGTLGTAWTQPGFDDNAWQAGLMDLGYENSTGYGSLIGLNTGAVMSGLRSSCYLRLAFPGVDPAGVLDLTLRMRYDDGFAVYLNGVPLPEASRNAPASPQWNSLAAADHDDAEAVQYEDISLASYAGLLRPAESNLLAIHGLNSTPSSSDFLIGPQLVVTRGSYAEGYMTRPTPGAANANGVAGLVADPWFSVDRGLYEAPVSVAITCSTPQSVIRYTRNGDTPTATSGFVYTGPLQIGSTTILRAAAFRDGWEPSPTGTRTYLFPEDVLQQSPAGQAPPGWPQNSVNGQRFDYGMDPDVISQATVATLKQALQALTIVSLVTDQPNLTDPATGIYVSPQSRGEEAERPVSVEILNDALNPLPGGFQQNGGLRIRGGFSRDPNNPKHSFRLFFRRSYGKGKMDYPLFGEGLPASFDGIDLRTSQDASWAYLGSGENTFLRDETARATFAEMAPGSRVRYVHLFLNGQYWGLYDTDERPNKGYGEQYFGGSEDDYDVVKTSGYPGGHTTEASDGTMASGSGWHQLWTGARAVHANPSNANYFKLMGLAEDGKTPTADPVVLDPVNLADYLLTLFYMGGNDGPVSDYVGASNNWFGLRDRTGQEGFRFFIHDFEQSLGLEPGCNQRVGSGSLLRPWSNTVSGLNDYARSNPEFIHEDLAWNPEYRLLFADRAHRHFFNDGAMTDARVLGRMQELAARIDIAIWGESARWGDSVRAVPFVRSDWLAANQRLFRFIASGTTSAGGTGRVDEVIRQLRGYDAGTKPLYSLVNAPVFSRHGGGMADAGEWVSITQSNSGSPVIWLTLDGTDPRLAGGAVAPSAQVYSGPVLAGGWTSTLKARVLAGTEWSALTEAVFTRSSGPPPLVVSEIHAVPASPDAAERAAGFTDKEDFEFIEILNTGSSMVNVRGLQGLRGLGFSLMDYFMAPGQRAVIVRNIQAFRHRFGPAPVILGTWHGHLDDDGEELAVATAAGTVLTDFYFGTTGAWPQGLAGYSLVRRRPDQDPAAPPSWRLSLAAGGSPGEAESMSYQDWKSAQGVPDDTVDGDADGWLPFAEYAAGGNPGANDSRLRPELSVLPAAAPEAGRELVLRWTQRRGADDVAAMVQASSDMVLWVPQAAEVHSITANPDGTEEWEVRIPPADGAGSRRYFQIRWGLIP